jgi:hypothetical protein
VSIGGGQSPAWSRDGRELFFRGVDGSIFAARVAATTGFAASTPVKLFANRNYFLGAASRNFDVSPDGSKFLMIKILPSQEVPQFVFVEHWFEELKARVPTK